MIRYLAVSLLCLLSLLSAPARALPYSGVYFFGDSLTDVGNVQAVYEQIPHPPSAPAIIPGGPYDPQGRASNGPIFADVLAGQLGFAATPSVLGGNDFAFGGARTRYQTFGRPFQGILDQVGSFVDRPGGADAQSLYVVWGGANNLQDLIVGKTTDTLGNPVPGLIERWRYSAGDRHALWRRRPL
ncbi:MAG: SGNH/GDSL hydrolase family protein, partial [Propionivibrio sp.]